jgi:hypothetical protein
LPDGSFEHLKNLTVGDFVSGLSSQAGLCQPHTQSSCVQTESCKVEGSRSDCQLESHLCDEQPLQFGETDLYALQQLGGAQRRSHDRMRLGDEAEISLDSSHPSSTQSSFLRSLSDTSSAIAGRLFGLARNALQSQTASSRHAPSGEREVSDHCSKVGFFDFSSIDDNMITSIVSRGKCLVADHHVPNYENYYAHGTFHHNSGKSFNSARMVMRALLENPGTTIICWSQNQEASIEMQQPYLYQMLPSELRGKVKQQVANVNYNEKTGFTGNKFVLPNGSKCLFRFYSQFIANPKIIEGYRLGAPERNCKYINIGTWLDEYYMDEALIKRLYRRCNDNNAKILTSFTPLDGYTPLVSEVLNGAEIKKTMYGKLIKREMPYVMQPRKKSSSVVFFHTERNPFTNFQRLADDLEGEKDEEIQTIAYGYPVKSITTLFPLFNEEVHVVDESPVFNKKDWTCYQVVDPAGARSYVSLWAMVNDLGDIHVLREWPDRDTYGAWAEHGKSASEGSTWKFGSAAKKHGYDVKGYVELFKEIEDELGVEVFERIGDSRFFAGENDDNVTLFDQFAMHGMDFIPSSGVQEDEGLNKLDEFFWYNVNADVDEANKPIMHINRKCGNTIYSVLNYGKNGKKDEPLKDWVDALRYLALANAGNGPEHYGPNALGQKTQGGSY